MPISDCWLDLQDLKYRTWTLPSRSLLFREEKKKTTLKMPTFIDKQQHGRVWEGRSKEDSHKAPGEVGVPLSLFQDFMLHFSVSR